MIPLIIMTPPTKTSQSITLQTIVILILDWFHVVSEVVWFVCGVKVNGVMSVRTVRLVRGHTQSKHSEHVGTAKAKAEKPAGKTQRLTIPAIKMSISIIIYYETLSSVSVRAYKAKLWINMSSFILAPITPWVIISACGAILKKIFVRVCTSSTAFECWQ